MNYFDPEHIDKIKELNRSYVRADKLKRLHRIYNYSKNKFDLNLSRYKGIKVKYILFGEAPPWTEEGIPKYFYSNIESMLHDTIWKAFFLDPLPKEMNSAYSRLAKKGFLLIDTIPYALKFNSKVREKEIYKKLILEYLSNEVKRINTILNFDENLKIAFAFRINGGKIIELFKGEIKLGNQNIKLISNNIAADGSGFPKPNKLKEIFELENMNKK